MQRLADTHAGAEHGAEDDAVSEGRSRLQKSQDFCRAENHRKVVFLTGHGEHQLAGPEQDADYFHQYLLTERGGAKQNPGNITTLINADATAAAIRLDLRRATEQVRAGDKFIFFIAAHGLSVNGSDGYILAHDSRPDVAGSMLAMAEVDELLRRIQSMGAQVLVFADICHAGLLDHHNFANRKFKALFGEVSGLLADDDEEPSLEKRDLPGHENHSRGLFSYSLISVFSNDAPTEPSRMTLSWLKDQLSQTLAQKPVVLGGGIRRWPTEE